VTQVVSGAQADDPLYMPAIDQVRTGLNQRGLLYVGDCKLMALATRTHLQAGDDFYLGPFSLTHVPAATLDTYLQPVWVKEQTLTPVYRRGTASPAEKIAEGFERTETLTATVAGEVVTWTERRLVVRSLQHAQAAEAALRQRLAQAQTTVAALNERKQGKEPFVEVAPLRQAAETIVKRYAVEGLLELNYTEQVHERQVRKYGARPAETRSERTVSVAVRREETAIQAAIRRLGWRVYGTNAAQTELTLTQAVWAYREEYLVERGFGRLKGEPLTLTPMYLADDQRATGLIRLLSLGLRVLTLSEFGVRQRLAETGDKLTGLYAGNPTRATARPTTELMLRTFKGVFLSFITIGTQTYRHLTPLSELQQKILHLLDCPVSIYTRLAADFANPP
jgi:transposase